MKISKKNSFISQETELYIRVTDILKFYEVLLQRFLLSLKHSHYAYIPSDMHKTLRTLGSDKEQISFYEKVSGKLIF